MAKSPSTRPSRTGLPTEQQADALYQQALAALKQKQHAQAISHLTAALRAEPLHINALMLQARVLAEFDKYDSAIELMQLAVTQQPDEPDACFYLARWLTKVGRQRSATAMLHRCVQLRPNHDAPRRYLAALYGNMGHDEQSQYWAKKAIRSKAFSVRDAQQETKLTVLALFTQASGSLGINRNTFGIHTSEGHNNLASLLDSDHITLIRFHVDTLDQQPELLRKLPAADVIYNSITDPERCEHALQLAQKVCDRLDLPVINDPKAVLGASREGNYQRFKDNADIILPKSVKVEGVEGDVKPFVERAMQAHGFTYPVLVRVSGYQNGKYMQRVEDLERHDLSEINALTAKGPETLYIIQYHETGYHDDRAPDHPLYPKYRAFLIGGELYPTHVRFGYGDWNVHMPEHKPTIKRFPWLYEWEERYFADPAATLPEGMWAKLREAMQTVGLDYLGIDFAVINEGDDAGRLIVFEANAAMRNFLDQLEQDIPAHTASARAVEAAHQQFVARADSDAWHYQLPKGLPNPAADIVAATQASDACVVQEWDIQGELQGKGFREWFWHQLYAHGLEGWIRHTDTAHLQAVVEGHPERLGHLLQQAKDHASGNVDAIAPHDWTGERPQGVRVLERDKRSQAEPSA